MSTKLFNGHEIVGHTLESFLPQLVSLQAELQPLAQRSSAQMVTLIATNAHDRHVLGLEPSTSTSFLSDAEFLLLDRQRKLKASGHRDPVADFEFTLCLFPVEGRLLALTYAEQKDFLEVWNRQPWRRDFAYWNNTDAPEEVPADEWAERERLWGLVFHEGASTPAECGYSFTLLPLDGHFLFASNDEVEQHLPNLESRVKALLPVYMDHLCRQAGRQPPNGYREAMALLESAEGEQARAQLRERLGATELSAKTLRAGVAARAQA